MVVLIWGIFNQVSSPDVLSWWCLGRRRDGSHAEGWLAWLYPSWALQVELGLLAGTLLREAS